jgi:hypothetical protein
MAEIKSTLELVMERAAKMGMASKEEIKAGETKQEGMKQAALFLREEGVDLGKVLMEYQPADQMVIRNGMASTLLRNIVLPREAEQQKSVEKALQGLLQVSQGDSELAAAFGDMKSIMARYIEHRDQLRQQLEDQFAQQMQMMEQNLAKQTGMKMKLAPSQHPKFQEEWLKVQTELNGQYGKAINQYKALIEQRLIL